MTAKNKGPKIDAYERVTNQMLTMLEGDLCPWRKTWKGSTAHDAPVSMSSGKAYAGINPWLLQTTAIFMGYGSRHWGTFNAARANGGKVRKGEKATSVVFWKWIKVEDKVTGEPKNIPFLRHFSVFNADQMDWPEGIPEKFAPVADGEGEDAPEFDPIEAAEAIASGYLDGGRGPSLNNNGGDRAYYRPALDAVSMPERKAFEAAGAYYSTLFHELGHSTGHSTRLRRKGVVDFDGFGSHQYSHEELVAEFTACFLCADAGIEDTRQNSAAYLKGWISVLKGDKKLVVMAASQAAKAAKLIRDKGVPAKAYEEAKSA